MSDDLEERVRQFNCMELPGQPFGMHMGTNYLVNDLWREVQRLRERASPGAHGQVGPSEADAERKSEISCP